MKNKVKQAQMKLTTTLNNIQMHSNLTFSKTPMILEWRSTFWISQPNKLIFLTIQLCLP